MSLEIFEKSENLGPTILMRITFFVVVSGFLKNWENFTFSKI